MKVLWGIVVLVGSGGLVGCDPLGSLDEVPRPGVERAPGGAARLPRVEAVVSMRRADILTVVADGATQVVHLAGVCAPSPVAGRFNRQFAAHTGLAVAALPRYGREAIDAVRGMFATGTWRVAALGASTNNGAVLTAVDFVDERDESMAGELLRRGYVACVGAAPRTVLAYEELERGAREAEEGMWRHAVPLGRRVRVESRFEREIVSRDRWDVYQQRNTATGRVSTEERGTVLERHEQIEERGVIELEIRVQPPVTRSYELLARYSFLVTDEYGRKQQAMSGLRDDGKRFMTRRTAGGERVRDTRACDVETALIVVTSAVTHVRIESASVANTKSEKAGIAYEQGQTVTGYEVEVWLGTNLVYWAEESG